MNPQSLGRRTTTCVRRVLLAAKPSTASASASASGGAAVRDFSGHGGSCGGAYTAGRLQAQPFPPDDPHLVASFRQGALASFSSSSPSSNDDTATTTSNNDEGVSLRTSNPGLPDLPPVDILIQNVHKASKYNQGNTRDVLSSRRVRRDYFWDVDFCRATADAYERYLVGLANSDTPSTAVALLTQEERAALLSISVVDRAFGILLKCKLKPHRLSAKVRDWERALGTLAETPLTATLSLRLVEVNGKAGNIGRVMSLLEYRTRLKYKPRHEEFVSCLTALEAAGWYLRNNRNIFLSDEDQPVIDNPTRWLDAILLNMNERKFPLTKHLSALMLDTFASRGRTGKAMHYFYSVHRTPVDNFAEKDEEDHYDVRDDEEYGEGDDFDASALHSSSEESATEEEYVPVAVSPGQQPNLPSSQLRPYKVRLKLKNPPPYYKIPTEVKGKLLAVPTKKSKGDRRKTQKYVAMPTKPRGALKIERETEPDWSLPLTAAFSFADSLTLGVCGHKPMELDLIHYNILIKTCAYRGALWRAMNVLDTVMPSAGVAPDNRSYDSLLSGLARVGDVTLMRDYYQQMMSQGIEPSLYTVRYIVDGLLNLGDVAGAVTVIQDFFNQHSILPPITTQLKVLEFALGLDTIYEAKRHLYFIQQLWKWEPHYKYESNEFIYYMKTYQRDPRLSKEALQHLFLYFGESLDENDFF